MKKIYIVRYDNGADYELNEEFTFKYCYTTRQKALDAIEELKQDKNFLQEVACFEEDYKLVALWVEEVELVED